MNIFKFKENFKKGPTLLKRVRPFQIPGGLRGGKGRFSKKGAVLAAVGVLCLAGVGGTLALNGFFGGVPER